MSHTIGQAEQNTQESNSNSMSPQDSANSGANQPEPSSRLSDADYEFLFNQLLEGVAHGWHDRRIIKFFARLEERGQQADWVAWLDRLREKVIKLPIQSKRQLGTIMIRLGEVTQSAVEVKQIGAASNRIGRELLFGNVPAEIWEYAGPDLPPANNSMETEQELSARLPDDFAALGSETVESENTAVEMTSPWDIEEENTPNIVLEVESDQDIAPEVADNVPHSAVSNTAAASILDSPVEQAPLDEVELDLTLEPSDAPLGEDEPEPSQPQEIKSRLEPQEPSVTNAPITENEIELEPPTEVIKDALSSETASAPDLELNLDLDSGLDPDLDLDLDSPTAAKLALPSLEANELDLELEPDSKLDSSDPASSYGEEFEFELEAPPAPPAASAPENKAAETISSPLDDALQEFELATQSPNIDDFAKTEEQPSIAPVTQPDNLTPRETDPSLSSRENTLDKPLDESSLELIESWFNLGLKQVSAGEYDSAIASWDKALKINANLSEAWHNRGSALGRLGNYEEAVQSFQNALKIDPGNYQAWNDRAHALYQLQQWSDAVKSWSQAIEIMPGNHLFWYNRGCALEQLSQWSEAIASYEKALEIKPDFQPGRSRYINLIADNSPAN